MRRKALERRVHQSTIENDEASELELRTPKCQLRRSKRMRKSNLVYTNVGVAEEEKNKRT